MPHGGGHHHGGGGHHHGGGGHHYGGGGHHHGGGFHHHHHVGYRHHHRGVYYSNGPYWYYRRRPLTWVFSSIFFTVVIIVATSVTIRYTSDDYGTGNTLQYAPTDTRIISVSNTLCQGLKLRVGDEGDYGYLATLYMLDSPPELTGRESFTFTDQPSFAVDNYKFYYYYLHPGSNFTVSTCLTDTSASITYYLFKGHKRFTKWQDNEYATDYKDRFVVNTPCSAGNQTRSYKVNSKSEDYYYLVFDSLYTTIYTQVNVTMSFDRTQYEIANSSVVQSCSMNSIDYGSSCSVSVPLSGQTALLAVSPSPNTEVDWTDGIDLDTICNARIWMYVIISLSVLVGVVGIIATLVVVCVCIRRRKKKKEPSPLPVSNVTEEPVAPLLPEQPFQPPVNPNYNSNAYGPVMEAPPVYKP